MKVSSVLNSTNAHLVKRKRKKKHSYGSGLNESPRQLNDIGQQAEDPEKMPGTVYPRNAGRHSQEAVPVGSCPGIATNKRISNSINQSK